MDERRLRFRSVQGGFMTLEVIDAPLAARHVRQEIDGITST
jgi:hypothetical protein